jgi:carbon-monoxide dehydrogenase medium subunit
LNEAGTIARAGIGLCNAASTSVRARTAESFLVSKPAAPDNINEAARLAMDDSDPVEDDRGPVDYKRAMVRVLTRRALNRALDRARGGN